jgi:hypothetical protein
VLTTVEANAQAARGHSASLARALKRLGMRRCSERSVRYQSEEGAGRPSWYCCFWRWFQALWLVNRKGAEFLYEDFQARVEALRAAEASEAPARDWLEQVALCAREHSEAIAEAMLRRDERAIRAEVTDEIRELRRLLAMLSRPAPESARAEAA